MLVWDTLRWAERRVNPSCAGAWHITGAAVTGHVDARWERL